MSKTDYYLLLMSFWIILGNVWHIVLLTRHKGHERPPTISEHAVASKRLLLIHRIVHSLPLLLFAPVIFGYLLPRGYNFAAILLTSAIIFDSIEVLTLNKNTASLDSRPNTHFVTAWLMALSYFAYSLVISHIAGLSPWVYGSILSICVLFVILSNRAVSAGKSLVLQMTYFILVSLVGVLANIKLIMS